MLRDNSHRAMKGVKGHHQMQIRMKGKTFNFRPNRRPALPRNDQRRPAETHSVAEQIIQRLLESFYFRKGNK